ncbi:MSHA biogenesis protein MshK [Shewanella yunxiaonensis]|uniref:MSHA biogenesis protein MshK n=2 Tax=Shewanellaceae TaxID=267890 RepID=A0ABX7YYD8_9GAMM|nr:MSHA biogenesis protein MshK [Shewanella yunxiaonensis]
MAGAASLRDPTLPPYGLQSMSSSSTNAPVTLVLNSVVQGPSGTRAVINNQLYRRGDRLQGTSISAIHANEVVLADGRKLRLFQTITEPNKKR